MSAVMQDNRGTESSEKHDMTNIQMSETILIGTLLALAGGFLDAYTYICRGGVFANAQTGNIVLFSIHLTQMEWARAAASAIPVIAFALGIIVTETVRRRQKLSRQKLIGFLHWRQGMLILEIVILAAAVFIPEGPLDSLVNVMISFICSLQCPQLQTCAWTRHRFDYVHRQSAQRHRSTVSLHGDQRPVFQAQVPLLLRHNPGLHHRAVGGTASSNVFPEHALVCPIVVYIIAFLVMIKEDGGIVENYGR